MIVVADFEAEAGALACVLSANGTAPRLLDQLEEADFFDLRHKNIFRALVALQFDNAELTPVTLYQRLKDSGEMPAAGGEEYLLQLPDRTPSAANFPTYLEVVRDRSERRRMLENARKLEARARDTSKPVAPFIGDLLTKRSFNPHIEPPEIKPIYSVAGVPISTPGNLTTITAGIKSGKTAVMGAMAASAMHGHRDCDLLGFESINPDGRAVLWLDSEQSFVDFWHCVNRSVKRAGQRKPPAWLCAYCLTGLGHAKAWQCANEALRAAADKHGGIHSVLLDGAADFIADVNDAEESNGFVAKLHGLAIEYDCAIVSAIHFNPGSEKSRGHLGSQLERKAETNLSLQKDTDESTVMFSTKNRRAGIPKSTGPRFQFDTAAGMHVSIASRQSATDTARREQLLSLAEDAFRDRPGMRYSDLRSYLVDGCKMSPNTAERRIAALCKAGVVSKGVAGIYAIIRNSAA